MIVVVRLLNRIVVWLQSFVINPRLDWANDVRFMINVCWLNSGFYALFRWYREVTQWTFPLDQRCGKHKLEIQVYFVNFLSKYNFFIRSPVTVNVTYDSQDNAIGGDWTGMDDRWYETIK